MKKRFPFHPLLFAVYPILQLYAYNTAEVRFAGALPALTAALVLACLATALARLALKDFRKAAVLASFFLWLFFSWGNTHLGLKGVRIGHFQLGQSWLIGIFFLATLIFAGYALWRTRYTLFNLTRILNVAGLFLVLSCIVMTYVQHARQTNLPAAARQKPTPPAPAAVKDASAHPDIYFILLDEYPRSDVLRKELGGDNSEFLEGLRKLGFYVADRNASNYPRTVMSVASTFNMNYLDALLGEVKPDCRELGLPSKLITHNAVFTFLRERGYRTVYLPPEYGAGRPADVDLLIESGVSLSEFNKYVLQMTPLEAVMPLLVPNYSPAELHRKHVLFTLESLRKLPHMHKTPEIGAAPFFVYAHVLCPHEPIVWGAQGEKVFLELPDSAPDTWKRSPEARRLYADQVAHLSKLVEETVKAILDRSPQPPVIIVCSDHGTQFEVDWDSPANSNLQERMSNLAAFYFPDGGDKRLYPTLTNVNFFRIVFDQYFGTKYDVLPDRSWFSTNGSPYKWIPVPMEGEFDPRAKAGR